VCECGMCVVWVGCVVGEVCVSVCLSVSV
jgi:hypothetical protein